MRHIIVSRTSVIPLVLLAPSIKHGTTHFFDISTPKTCIYLLFNMSHSGHVGVSCSVWIKVYIHTKSNKIFVKQKSCIYTCMCPSYRAGGDSSKFPIPFRIQPFFFQTTGFFFQTIFLMSAPNRSSTKRYTTRSSAQFWAPGMGRQHKIQVLANAIYEGFVQEDGGEWLSRTGSIVTTCNLRASKTRRAFKCVRFAAQDASDDKRFWTKASLRDAVALMMKQRGLEIPRTSGFVFSEWLKDQVDSLHDLSQRARKNAWTNWRPFPTIHIRTGN